MKQPRPLSSHAIFQLRRLCIGPPQPCQIFNAGVVRKLVAEGLAEIVQLPSPYGTHKGQTISHLRATEAGRARVEPL